MVYGFAKPRRQLVHWWSINIPMIVWLQNKKEGNNKEICCCDCCYGQQQHHYFGWCCCCCCYICCFLWKVPSFVRVDDCLSLFCLWVSCINNFGISCSRKSESKKKEKIKIWFIKTYCSCVVNKKQDVFFFFIFSTRNINHSLHSLVVDVPVRTRNVLVRREPKKKKKKKLFLYKYVQFSVGKKNAHPHVHKPLRRPSSRETYKYAKGKKLCCIVYTSKWYLYLVPVQV